MATHDNVNQEAEIVYKTKVVQFLGRSVPIILQNDNGPCPLLAICNVLLLRNNVNLNLDIAEIASSKLLSLVAERLLDSNSNIENRDEEYIRNQQQNISDAIPLLHHLATGLDVNLRFRNIHDFEFTPECAVFDLLDIGLVHGWLCDPQDELTSKIIGANSYNTLLEKLVLQTARADLLGSTSADAVDFAAATTATLGVPSPSREVLLKTKAYDDPDESELADLTQRKGDAEETSLVLQALKLSRDEMLSVGNLQVGHAIDSSDQLTINSDHGDMVQKVENSVSSAGAESSLLKKSKEGGCSASLNGALEDKDLCDSFVQVSSEIEQWDHPGGCGTTGSFEMGQGTESKAALRNRSSPIFDDDGLTVCPAKDEAEFLEIQTMIPHQTPLLDAPNVSKGQDVLEQEVMDQYKPVVESRALDFSFNVGAPASSCSKSSEPLYEGEAEVGTSQIGSREPLYEGEASLAQCAEQTGFEEEGVIINNFLNSHASQLTYYGLFCLQDGLKDRELCVFFRNNHFNTMFKYNEELYLLVTDQGYMTQSDIVWEKLDEVHGNTVFVTGSFMPFRADESNGLWDEQGAIAATADYLSSQHQIGETAAKEPGFNNSDLELAMSLQHQEFEQQEQQPRIATSASVRPQSRTTGMVTRADGSRLITGPKKSSYSKPDPKSKCVLM